MSKRQRTLVTICAIIVALVGLTKENTLNAYRDYRYNRDGYYNDPYYRPGVVGGTVEVADDTVGVGADLGSDVIHSVFGGRSRRERRYDNNIEQENEQLQYENARLRNR